MREENPQENRAKASKLANQNQVPAKGNSSHGSVKGLNGNISKVKNSWGSHIVKGFLGEKKSNLQNTTSQGKRLPLSSSNIVKQKNPFGFSHSRVKRSLIGDLSCSVSATQVHPHIYHQGGSRDLFLELDHWRSLVKDSKEREIKFQAELSDIKRNPRVFELETELELKRSEIDKLAKKVQMIETEKSCLCEQLQSLNLIRDRQEEIIRREDHESVNSVELEVVELRRLNKELQLQKRNLASRLSSMESQLSILANVSEVPFLLLNYFSPLLNCWI